MGLSKIKRCNIDPDNKKAAAPNPELFKILSILEVKGNVVAEIIYLNCTNYDGHKLCVYKDTSAEKIRACTFLDPHFSDSGVSPFARFRPDTEGYAAAVLMAYIV